MRTDIGARVGEGRRGEQRQSEHGARVTTFGGVPGDRRGIGPVHRSVDDGRRVTGVAIRVKRFVLLSYLASSDAVFLTIGRRTRPYWQSYVAWSATIPSGRSTLRKRSRSCQSMSAWKSSVCEPGRSVMAVVMTVSSSAVRTRTRAAPFSVSTDSIDPVMAFAMSRDSRSISQASQTAGSSFNSSYRPNRVPAGTSSRPCSSSSSDEIVPSARW